MLKNHLFLNENLRTTNGQLADNPGTVSPEGRSRSSSRKTFGLPTALAPESYHAASPRPLARTNETKRFPGWAVSQGHTPPTSNNEAKPARPFRVTKTIPKAYRNEAEPARSARVTKTIPKAYRNEAKPASSARLTQNNLVFLVFGSQNKCFA